MESSSSSFWLFSFSLLHFHKKKTKERETFVLEFFFTFGERDRLLFGCGGFFFSSFWLFSFLSLLHFLLLLSLPPSHNTRFSSLSLSLSLSLFLSRFALKNSEFFRKLFNSHSGTGRVYISAVRVLPRNRLQRKSES